MRRFGKKSTLVVCLAAACGFALLVRGQLSRADDPRLWEHRNLGKAFYENPTTQKQAAEEFRQALALAPNSSREQLNYGLALLRAGDLQNGVAQLEKVQKSDPALPHTWFNLGVTYQKQGDEGKAQQQFEQMTRLAPSEPVSHYHLGALYKQKNDLPAAVKEFEAARDLDPRLAAPHFQLYGLYRQMNRAQDAAAELQIFQDLKKQQEGAAVPEDMDWSSYAEIYDPLGSPDSDSPAGVAPSAPVYRDQKIADGFTGASGVAVLDVDGGVRPSLIAWSAQRVTLFSKGTNAVADSGLGDLRDVVSIAPGDFDNDGLPDLCVLTSEGAWLYHNAGGKFQRQTELTRGSFRKAIWIDYDHDYDADLVLIGNDSKLMRNNGTAGFSDESRRFPFAQGEALDAVRFDLDPDTPGFDLVVSYRNRPGVLYHDLLGGSYEARAMDALPIGAESLAAFDLNHDGRTDLAALASALPAAPQGAQRTGLLLLNRDGQLQSGAGPKPDEFPFTATGASALADFDGKGRLDRAWISSEGALHLSRDVTPNYGSWIEIALTGVKSPKAALNAKIEVKAGTRYEKVTYSGVPVSVRLGDRKTVDTIRITWPNGLIQNETKQPVNRVTKIVEAPRLSGSCPMVFTWNGERFEFITDVLGVAPLGASSGDGKYFPVDHDEYVSISGDSLKPRDGQYEVRVTEELREVSYIDQIKLIALDHPAGEEIVTNEKFKSPPFPEFRLFGADRKVYPAAARDTSGADVLATIQKRDHVYPDRFERDQAGVAELHHLDLDFGNAAAANQAALILYGWVDWADGSTFLSASQAHQDLTFPYLQVKDASGNWKTVIEDMGIPSGKPKPMAVDLTGKFLSASREVRIVTNLCVYWDEIYLIENSLAPRTRMTALPIASGDLHFRGFSKATIHPERKQPEMFDYQTVSSTTMWNPTSGDYTRYGDVHTLLAESDDRMVVMGSGDEIRVQFRESGLPDLPAGWKRDFLLLVDGWAKDGDANTAFSQSVLPLPFHAMSSYPYPKGQAYPQDPAHAAYLREFNIRPALRLIRSMAN